MWIHDFLEMFYSEYISLAIIHTTAVTIMCRYSIPHITLLNLPFVHSEVQYDYFEHA